ncbi:MAG: hypothetical protein OEL57_05520 [Trichlorobacter sp.]|uniref:hypothetical protein n=1 Tax=Trichlorobacter sp. TaxID=2911007 RepID=UPI0025697401|nr:hypothetical protein [Trichlorobacter sp.]MDK9717353.1 hypothetical protein [Trichlorobacter sp.]
MKTRIMNLLIPMLGGSATSAFAADGALQDGGGPLIWFFIGFGVLVVMVQAVPAMVMLYSMVKAVFSPSENSRTASATGHK